MRKGKFCKKVRAFRVCYANIQEAQPKIEEIHSRYKLRLYTYWCPKCQAVHLSKHAAPKNWRWA